MALSNTVTEVIKIGDGLVMERGIWAEGAGGATGNITAVDGTVDYGEGKIAISDIIQWGFTSNGDTAVMPAQDVAPNVMKITYTAGDAGTYYLIGKAR
jgi:hypothetical protein